MEQDEKERLLKILPGLGDELIGLVNILNSQKKVIRAQEQLLQRQAELINSLKDQIGDGLSRIREIYPVDTIINNAVKQMLPKVKIQGRGQVVNPNE